jgi:hypothetical protein
MTLTLDEAIELAVQRYDPEDIIEALEITSEELSLLPDFEQRFNDNRHKFEEIEE